MHVAISTSSFATGDPAPLELLCRNGVEIRPNPHGRRLSQDEAIEHLQGIDGLIAGLEPLNREVLTAAGDLKVIARVGIGLSNVDVSAAKDLDIKISNTPDAPTEAVAELTITAALSLIRRFTASNEALHRREWTKLLCSSLTGAKVLFIGYGRIGRRTAEHFRHFGAEILAHDPYLTNSPSDATPVSLAEGLRHADLITIHADGENTILGPDQFAAMKDGVFILNSARGGLIDESALTDALRSEKVAGVWLDAFREEPYNGPLVDFAQVLMTPHVCTYTRQCRSKMEMQAVQNLLRDLSSIAC